MSCSCNSRAASLTALAGDYDNGGAPRYDSQADQTRALNNESLRRAQEEDGPRASRSNDNDDDDNIDGAAVVPTGNPDAQNDADDNDDVPLPDERRKARGS